MATKTITTEVKLLPAELRQALTNWLSENNYAVGTDVVFSVVTGSYPVVDDNPNTAAVVVRWTSTD